MWASASTLVLWGPAALVGALTCLNIASDPKNCLYVDSSIILQTKPPVGTEEVYEGVTMYVTGNLSPVAVLYATDIYGIDATQNRLHADSFGAAGFLTVAPDLFNGHPWPTDLDEPGLDRTKFLEEHGPEITDPLIAKGIQYLKEKKGVDKVAIAGYCFGGRYAFRFAGPAGGTVAAFAAHPSLYTDAEVAGVGGPTGVAAGQNDTLMPPERRYALEGLLAGQSHPWELTVYSGAPHGFAVSGNLSDPQQRFARLQSFSQAVSWFHSWV